MPAETPMTWKNEEKSCKHLLECAAITSFSALRPSDSPQPAAAYRGVGAAGLNHATPKGKQSIICNQGSEGFLGCISADHDSWMNLHNNYQPSALLTPSSNSSLRMLTIDSRVCPFNKRGVGRSIG